MTSLEIHYDTGGSWAALYVDGTLDRVGDAYLAEERAFELLGVKIVQDGAFLRGQDSADGVARTLVEITEYRTRRDAAVARATELRERAKALLAEAGALDPEARGLQ